MGRLTILMFIVQCWHRYRMFAIANGEGGF